MEEKVLTTKTRKDLSPSDFVFPAERRYPIHDLATILMESREV